jgi:DNA mismatch repair protein MutS2
MNSAVLRTLEYNQIIDLLEKKASSSLGKERARKLCPSSDFEEVEGRMRETAEAVRIRTLIMPPLGGIRDIRSLLHKVKIGAVLEIHELVDIMSTMYAMRNIKRFFKELEETAPIHKEWAGNLEILGQLEHNLDNVIDEHGNMRDDASVELKRIRREIKSSHRHIKDRLASVLRASEYQKYFQDTIVTMRSDRYVVPIKQEYRQYFPGIVHDQSSSGSTLFIEPMAIVDLNNDVKQLVTAECHELERILRSLSQQVERNRVILERNCEILADIDFSFAKAGLARDMLAIEPILNKDGYTALLKARHPLIDPAKVVPIDITLGRSYHTLLITGPNTGGKTVSMKTLGLHVLMVQSGCFIPAASGSEVSVYREVFADIGDEQSIAQSLSTFSAHMIHLIDILAKVECEDLVLLDELGAGTDPEEGAALAMAILEQLMLIGTKVVATTHYSELKTFAYTREDIENACVEFDIKTLCPTYRLLTGIPGASNAFAISNRLGLANSLILRAQQLIKADHAQFENVINTLENEKMMYEQRNADILERQQRVAQLEAKVISMKQELSQKKAQVIRKAQEESAVLVRRARRESEQIIKDLKEQFNDQGIKKRQESIETARKQIQEGIKRTNMSVGVISQQAYMPVDLEALSIGDIVYVTSLNQKGSVVAVQGKEITVQLGSMKMNIKASKCRFVEWARKENVSPSKTKSFLGKVNQVKREIDIRGMLVDEAEEVIGKYIDDAVLAGLSQVIIIHGKGTGALRKGIQEYLKNNRNILSIAFADMNQGGTGATVAELK